MPAPLDRHRLPDGVTARFVEGVNGLSVHILEAGAGPGRPLVLLLHGFPELAYSWRRMFAPLAAAGFHVVAPDQRGYGRTTGWSPAYDQPLAAFSLINLAADAHALVKALGHTQVSTLIGHDFGSPVSAWAALLRPDVFKSLILMSAPFAGPPAPQSGSPPADPPAVPDGLAALARPRKHYHWYYATRAADADMRLCPEGVDAFLRAYFHMKSGDWRENAPYRLAGWTAGELAKLPTYYVMDANQTMAETVRPHRPAPAEIARGSWLTDADLAVYAEAFAATTFQGGLNWYRSRFDAAATAAQSLFHGRTIDVPAMFVAGACDWGVHQVPGAYERMQSRAVSTDWRGAHLIEGAGHWVMQEKPDETAALLVEFCREHV